MNRLRRLAAAIPLLVPAVCMADASAYTHLARDCRDITYHGQPARQCAGKGNWHVLVVFEGERSYLVLKRQAYLKSFRDELFSGNIVGQFPEIGGGETRAEWRIGSNGRPYALIVRVFAVDPEKSLQTDRDAKRSRLIVIGLGSQAFFLGTADDNQQARLLAESASGKTPR